MTRAETLVKPAPAIDRFAPLMAEMDRPMMSVLEGLLADLEGLSEIVSLHRPAESGEILGYEGISSRGGPSDILSSEWAVYDLDRTEFLRRMAMRETLYWRHLLQNRSGGRAVCAIVDAGAWMLGHNRLVALAALFWLADLALRAGITFRWCVSGDVAEWREGLTRAQVKGLLGQVARRELTDAWIEDAVATLPAEKDTTSEIWLIGHRGLESNLALGRIRAALLAGPAQPDETGKASGAAATLWSGGRLRREVALRFPEDTVCIAALRRPFAPRDPGPQPVRDEAGTPGRLAPDWYAHHWVQLVWGHIVIRWREGLLLLPAQVRSYDKARWYPLPAGARIIGIFADAAQFCFLWQPEDNKRNLVFSKGSFWKTHAKSMLETQTIRLSGVDETLDLHFVPEALPLQGPSGQLALGHRLPLHDSRGRAYVLDLSKRRMTEQPDAPRLFAQDGRRRLFLRPGQTGESVRVGGMGKGVQAGTDLIAAVDNPDIWTRRPRLVRIAGKDNTALVSTDGRTFDVWRDALDKKLSFQHGCLPAIVQSPGKGVCYDPASGGFFDYKAKGALDPALSLRAETGQLAGLNEVRMGFNGHEVFGLEMNEGQARGLIQVGTGRRRRPLVRRDLIAEAAEALTMKATS